MGLTREIARRSAKTLLWILLVVVLLCCSIYVPPFQRLIVKTALSIVNSSPDMEVKVDEFKLKFPMTIEARGVEVYQKGDTMLLAKQADVRVNVLPILNGELDVKAIEFDDVFLKMGNPDSAMWLRGEVNRLKIDPTVLHISDKRVAVGRLDLNGGRLDMIINQDTTPPTPPSPVDWHIAAGKINLSDVEVNMRMLPAFESINAGVGDITVDKADLNLKTKKVKVESVKIDSVNAVLLTPPQPLPSLSSPPNPYKSEPMSIEIGTISLSAQQIVYGVSGAQPQPGLDFNHLQFSDIELRADSILSFGPTLHADLEHLSAHSSTGVNVDVSGAFEMDSIEMRAQSIDIKTDFSEFELNALMGIGGDTPSSNPVDIDFQGELATADLQRLFPSMDDMIAQLPQNRRIAITAIATGTMSNLKIDRVEADIPKHLLVKLSGGIRDLYDADKMNGNLQLTGNIADGDFVERTISSTSKSKSSFNIPPLSLNGDVSLNGKIISGKLKAATSGGLLALDAKWNARREGYEVDLSTEEFPVNSFLPGLGIGRATVKLHAKGAGLDFMSAKSSLDADIDAIRVVYNNRSLSDLSVKASMANGNANVGLNSRNTFFNGSVTAAGNLAGREYKWNLSGDISRLDLYALGLSDTLFNVATRFNMSAQYAPSTGSIDATLAIPLVNATMGEQKIYATDINAGFLTNDSISTATLDNHDLALKFSSPESLDSIISKMSEASVMLADQLETRSTDIKALQRVLPRFEMTLKAGQDNVMHSYLADNGILFDSIDLVASNDSTLNLNGNIKKLVYGDYDIDDLKLTIDQTDGQLKYSAVIDNLPGTMDKFANVNISGSLADNRLSAFIHQKDIQGKTGYHLGAEVAFSDSTLRVHIEPENPVIDYIPWNINKGNFIELNTLQRHIDADLSMSNDESSVRIFTDHDSSHEGDGHQEDVNVQIKNIKIQQWLAVSPFSPPMKGDLSADIKVGLFPKDITGKGTVTLADFTYGKNKVGTFDLGVDVSTSPSGALYAKTSLAVDGREVMEAHGNLNDTAAPHPFLLDFTLDRFPLALANPFIGPSTGSLSGFLNGDMDITGSMSEPKFNGFLQFDSARVNMTMLGSPLRFSDQKIAVDSNIVRFNDYAIYGVNDNPLLINGDIDIRHLSNVAIDLGLTANDMQIIGSKRKKGSEIYGNAFINLDAKAKGNLRFLNASAELYLLPGTNVTYVIPGGAETITSRSSSDMVKFVNFADTAAVEAADTIAPSGMMINLDAILHIAQGSTIAVDLSPDGGDRVQVQSNGTLDFSMDYMGDTRLTGRLNINKGFFRYNPPVISQLNFDFVDGSYVTFNGALLNPQLNVHFQEKVKANVTQEGQNSRLINFLVGLGVTGSLENMNVAFDLSTDDDITVANELQSMSPEQRANQAMNLLLYNTYTGPGTKASSSISGNPLYSFLESQLNSWMTRNVKAVDISFGFDQYDKTTNGATSTTTSYSYKVSKTFLNDRFKIVVGGNYTTDADPDENLSQNLINDISFEYMLNRSGSMYIRLFRHTGYESILEGEVTQTGVGFVYRRKLRSLRDMFRWIRPNSNNAVLPAQGAPLDSVPVESTAVSPSAETRLKDENAD